MSYVCKQQQQQWTKLLSCVNMLRGGHRESCNPVDHCAMFHCLCPQTTFLNAPIVGWALHAPTQVPREHWPASTIQELLANADVYNKRLIVRTRPSSDSVLDEEALSNTNEEMSTGTVSQPVFDPCEIPFAQFCLVLSAWFVGTT